MRFSSWCGETLNFHSSRLKLLLLDPSPFHIKTSLNRTCSDNLSWCLYLSLVKCQKHDHPSLRGSGTARPEHPHKPHTQPLSICNQWWSTLRNKNCTETSALKIWHQAPLSCPRAFALCKETHWLPSDSHGHDKYQRKPFPSSQMLLGRRRERSWSYTDAWLSSGQNKTDIVVWVERVKTALGLGHTTPTFFMILTIPARSLLPCPR